jgi:hypothetical protein
VTALVPIPATCAHRPTAGGFVQPFANVELADGGVDFRSAHHARWLACWKRRWCQVCGLPLKHPVVLLGSATSLRTLVFDEPPLHAECAVYTSRACPMVAGERTHYADRTRIAHTSRGQRCAKPGCDCGGWVPTPGQGAGKAGEAAEDWFAFYIDDYALAYGPDGGLIGGVCQPADVFVVRHVSTPGQGRVWRRLEDPFAGYEPPQLSSSPPAPN